MPRQRTRVILAVLCLATAAESQDGLHLAPPVVFAIGESPRDVEAADVDGDGILDLVVAATFGPLGAATYLGDGAGGFGAAVTCGVGTEITAIDLRDVDQDGLPEMAAATTFSFHLLANVGGGAFESIFAGGFGSGVSLVDMNGDGEADVFLGSGGGYGAYIFESMRFAGAYLKGPDFPGLSRLGLADMDADGDEDVLRTIHDADAVTIVHAPYGSKADVLVGTVDGPVAVLGADLDADGLMDIVTAEDGTPALSVLRGTDGGFSSPASFPLGSPPSDLEFADLDGDGQPELVTVTSDDLAGATLWVFDASTGGQLSSPTLVSLGGHGEVRLALGDLDRDDRLDLAATMGADDTLAVVLNDARWWNHGGGQPVTGASSAPLLVGTGSLEPDTIARLELTGAPASAPVFLVAGLSRIFQPFQGATLVPSPDVVVAGLATDAAGFLALDGRWPTGLPAGQQLTFQMWVGGPQGFSVSAGVSAEQP
jgi:hypothetical protein